MGEGTAHHHCPIHSMRGDPRWVNFSSQPKREKDEERASDQMPTPPIKAPKKYGPPVPGPHLIEGGLHAHCVRKKVASFPALI